MSTDVAAKLCAGGIADGLRITFKNGDPDQFWVNDQEIGGDGARASQQYHIENGTWVPYSVVFYGAEGTVQ